MAFMLPKSKVTSQFISPLTYQHHLTQVIMSSFLEHFLDLISRNRLFPHFPLILQASVFYSPLLNSSYIRLKPPKTGGPQSSVFKLPCSNCTHSHDDFPPSMALNIIYMLTMLKFIFLLLTFPLNPGLRQLTM